MKHRQWAAGAVRRALAAHSLQHKQFVDTELAAAGYGSPRRGSDTSSTGKPSPFRDLKASPFRDLKRSRADSLSPFRRSGKSLEHAIKIADEEAAEEKQEIEETKDDEAAQQVSVEMAEEKSSPKVVVSETELDEAENDQLQLAITNSMAEDTAAPRATRYLQYSTPPPRSPAPTSPLGGTPPGSFDVAAIESEQNELKKLRNRQMRDVEGFSDEMVEEVMELLRLFGVPYLVCPMEAEAQCAALEQLGLVDGIITDDSDIFPFGGKKVYKNIFHNQKFVEAFFAKDIETELGFTQDEMISLALLLGSDYTDGIRGIGIVNATEVVTAYPGSDGLEGFKKWVQAFNLTEEAQRVADKKAKKSDEELAAMEPRERFQFTHANARRKWELGDEFPNAQVVKAYKYPQVDRSDARFSWSLPDLAGLRTYTAQTFGWDQSKTDSVLLPLMEKAASAARGTQTRIDQFFRTYDDEVRYAKIRSKRLRSAVEGRAKPGSSKSAASGGPPKATSKIPSSSSKTTPATATTTTMTTTKKKITKKKTTLAALGFAKKK